MRERWVLEKRSQEARKRVGRLILATALGVNGKIRLQAGGLARSQPGSEAVLSGPGAGTGISSRDRVKEERGAGASLGAVRGRDQ